MALERAAGGVSGLKSTGLENLRSTQMPMPQGPAGAEFKRALEQAVQATNAPKAMPGAGELKFSNHAVERMRSRGIQFQPDELKNIAAAVQKASAKGAKDTLVLSGENALIVSVKNNTVVTVMDRQAMKDNVFTNIDSTVVI